MDDQKAIQSEIFKVSVDLRACETSLETLRIYLQTLLDDGPLADAVTSVPQAYAAAIQRYAAPPTAHSRRAF